MRPFTLAAGTVFALAAMSCSPATPATTSPTPARAPGGAGPGGLGARPGADAEPAPKKYEDVIKGDVTTKEGLFKAHQIGSKLFFEIPAAQFGKDLLLVTQIAKTNEGDGYGGQTMDERVVRWERRGNPVLLRGVSYGMVADPSEPIAMAVRNSNNDVILGSFNVATYGPDSAAVVDVTRLYTSPPSEIGVSYAIRGQVDQARTFLERVATYPENVEVEATLTINATPTPQSFIPGLPPSPVPPGTPPTTKSVGAHWSRVKLPDVPM